jgi:hypothetical protein
VVETYLRALDGHDCQTAEELWVDKDADTWCDDIASIGSWRIAPVSGLPDAGTADVATVQVRFDLDWRPFQDDGSIGEGKVTWSYSLTRAGAGKPWRIYSEGMG